MSTEITRTIGQIVYEGYCARRGWKSIKGEPLPQYKDQAPGIIEAWEGGAADLRDAIERANSTHSEPTQ